MKRITDIKELKPGDKIWHINKFNGNADILEFVCIHPHNEAYSIFLDINYDGMPKFYNDRIKEEEYFLYDGTNKCWECMHLAEQTWYKRQIQYLEERLANLREKMKEQ